MIDIISQIRAGDVACLSFIDCLTTDELENYPDDLLLLAVQSKNVEIIKALVYAGLRSGFAVDEMYTSGQWYLLSLFLMNRIGSDQQHCRWLVCLRDKIQHELPFILHMLPESTQLALNEY